jgi:hypothetical protein
MIPLPIFAQDTPVSVASPETISKSTLDTHTQTAPAKGTLSLGAQPSLMAGDSVFEVEIGVADVTDTVAKIGSAIQDALDAADEDGSVTVTGSMTGVTNGLYLYIPENVTLIWNATYTVSTGTGYDPTITLYGGGAGEAFDMIGGEISTMGDNVCGVYVDSGSISITVSGGTISATGAYSKGIYAENENMITVSGNAVVKAEGNNGKAITTSGNVLVSENATVSASATGTESKSYAIHVGANNKVTVNGGTVSASATGTESQSFAIYIPYIYSSEVTVNGGTLSASASGMDSASYGIYDAGGSKMTVNKGGTIRSNAYCGWGVYSKGEVVVAGTVTASGFECYGVYSGVGDVTISDGLVFAYGIDSEYSDVINSVRMETDGTLIITSPGMAIAWDEVSYDETPYVFGKADHIIWQPEEESAAYWSKKDGENGIAYVNGENSGFLVLDVEVKDAAVITSDTVIDNEALADTEDPPTVTIALEDYTVAEALTDEDVSEWFDGLPTGVTVTATAEEGSDTITLTFGGTPTGGSDMPLVINIPVDVAGNDVSLPVAIDGDIKFEILPAEETPTGIAIDFEEVTLTGLDPDETYLLTVNGTEIEVTGESTYPISEDWMTGDDISIVKKGDGETTYDSAPVSFGIPERPDAPKGITYGNETFIGQKDGYITGVTAAMEYSDDGGATWKPCAGTSITGLAPGNYQVRVKAVEGATAAESSFASLPFNVTISAGADNVTDTDKDGVPDYVEGQDGTDPADKDSYKDADGDEVPDYVEGQDGTDPADKDSYKDTDGDGVPDYVEGQDGTDPADKDSYKDTDGDGVPDYVEQQDGTDPTDKESFKDENENGIPDYVEERNNPDDGDVKDTDEDGVPDAIEVQEGTDPNDACDFKDTDEDGVPDYVETKDGTDPTDKTSFKDVNGNGIPDHVEDHPAPVLEINGWVYANGAWKYFVDSVAKTGWFYDTNDKSWYLLDYDDGHMLVGWQYDQNYKSWFYLTGNGAMKVGWFYDKEYSAWFYLAGDGAMKVGWLYDNHYKAWFYFIGDGAMKVNKWVEYKGSWYYLSGNGTMLTGKQTIGGKTWTFKSNGVWVS